MQQEKKLRINLKGDEWTRLSISVWDDIAKTPEERKLKHPAMFPSMLVRRLIKIFSYQKEEVILDPFLGIGSTLYGAALEGRSGVGFEIVPEFAQKAKQRLTLLGNELFSEFTPIFFNKPEPIMFSPTQRKLIIYQLDARRLNECLSPKSVHLCITSPPYWNILTRKRTADYKETRKYSDLSEDLGNIPEYQTFLDELGKVFSKVRETLLPNRYLIVVVMDIRQGPYFVPYHMDVAHLVTRIGFSFEDIIIWDRRKEYNNLRPLGYPYKFIVNKTHEYILIFRKIG